MENKLKSFLTFALLQGLIVPNALAATAAEIEGKFIVGVLSTIVYSAIGIIMAAVSFKLMDVLTPGDLKKQLTEDKNIAIAIVVGLQTLGIAVIIAAAIAG